MDKQRAVQLGTKDTGKTRQANLGEIWDKVKDSGGLGDKKLWESLEPYRLFNPQTTEAQRQQKMGYSTWDTEKYQAMTDDEAEVYNRLAKNGYEKEAQEFLDAIDSGLNYRVTKARTDAARAAAQDGFIGGAAASAGSTLLNVLGTGAQAEWAAIRAARSGEAIDQYSEEMYGRNLSTALRSTVSEEVGNWAATLPTVDTSLGVQSGKFKAMPIERQQESNRKIAEFLYNTGMSMVDMVAMSPMGATGMSIMMGTNSAADALIDAKDRGLSDDQAMAASVIAGVAEIAAEKFSLDRLFSGKVSVSALKSALVQGGVEASEEAVTELANTLADIFIAGDQSMVQAAINGYIEQGFDYQQAQNKAFVDVLADIAAAGAGGFLSGFTMGGAVDIMNTNAQGRSVIDQTAQTFIKQGQTPEQAQQSAIDYLKEELRAVGALADEGTVAYELSQRSGDMSTGDIGRAYLANREQIQNIVSSGKAKYTSDELTAFAPATQQEAMQMDATTPQNLRRYQSEITAALNGEMDSNQMVVLGRPSQILSQYMNGENPLMLAQNVVKKVSAEDGKHQLNRIILDELPYQFDDPVAITGNTVKHEEAGDNSIVVWTDWQVGGQDPVVVPIRIDAKGNIGLYNNVNSAFPLYDPQYMEEMLRDGNILYTRGNENILDLLSQGREVPKRKIEDVSTDSISEASEPVNIPRRISELKKQYDALPLKDSREGIEIRRKIDDLLAEMERGPAKVEVAPQNDSTTQKNEISKKEQRFAENLSNAIQNLGMINSETKALGREYFADPENSPTLQDVQRKSLDEFTSEDFYVIAKSLLGSGKQRLYTKEPSRVLDTVAGGNKSLRNVLYNVIEKPFNEAGGNFGKSLTASVDSYKDAMKKYGIKPKSKEDIAAQRYGEGQYQGPDGEIQEYTLENLKAEFPDTWENIKGFAELNRQVYEQYLGRINSMLETVYPNILENAEDDYKEAVSKLEVANTRVKAMEQAIAEKEARIQRLQDIRNSKAKTDTKAFAKIEGGIAAEQARVESMKKDLAGLQKRQHAAEMNAQAQRTAIDSGAIYEGKRIIPRKDYFHHAQEMLNDYTILDFLKPKNVTEDVSPALAGISDKTKPKSRWWGAMRHRGQGAYYESASNSMASYIGMAEYKLAYDPLTNYMRKLEGTIRTSAETAHANNASGFIEWMKDWTDGISGKSDHIIDRGVQKAISRQTLNSINNLNKRIRANKVMGNVRTMIVQASNLPNAMSYITSPKAWAQGLQALIDYEFKSDRTMAEVLSQSQFMSQRYGSSAMDILEKDGISAKKIAGKGMELLQHWGDNLTWFSAFAQYNDNPQAAMAGMQRTYENAIDYADDVTRRAVGGRGVGEGALLNNSKVINLISPFQTEVLNQWNSFFEHAKGIKADPETRRRAAAGLAAYEIAAFGFNTIAEAVLGDSVIGMDFIGALVDALGEDEEEDDDLQELGQAILGTTVDAMPFINVITAFIGEETADEIFGEHSPTRYGTGNIGIRAVADAFKWGKDTVSTLVDIASGEANAKDLDWEGAIDVVGNFALPWGGTQFARTTKGLETYFRGGKYDKEGNLQYSVAQTPGNFVRAATLGRSAFPEQKEWKASGFTSFSDKERDSYSSLKTHGGDAAQFGKYRTQYRAMVEADSEKNEALYARRDEILDGNPALTKAEALERAEMDLGYKVQNSALKWAQQITRDTSLTDAQKADLILMSDISASSVDDIKDLTNFGVPVTDYVDIMTTLAELGMSIGDEKVTSEVKKQLSQQIYETKLTAEQKTALAHKTIGDDWIVDYSDPAAHELTIIGKSVYNDWQELKTAYGVSAAAFLQYYKEKDTVKGDLIPGTTDKYVSNSKKAKLVNLIESLDAPESFKEYVWYKVYEKDYSTRYAGLKNIDGVWQPD